MEILIPGADRNRYDLAVWVPPETTSSSAAGSPSVQILFPTPSTKPPHTSNYISMTNWSDTLQGINISPDKAYLKMIFLFPSWDMLISWRVPLFP